MQLTSSFVSTTLLLPTLLAATFTSVTHPMYWGKVLQRTPTAKFEFGSFRGVSERSALDSKCRWKCLEQQTFNCRTFQTYWAVNGSFYCDLFNTSLCEACSILVDLGLELLESRLWEVKRQEDPDAGEVCAEYPDWMIKGNCSLCGKIGYYGRNCSLRSSCASYFYDPGSLRTVQTRVRSTITPCFTRGSPISTNCRGPFTFWFQTGIGLGRWWTATAMTHSTFLRELREQIKQASALFGSVKRTLMIRASGPYPLITLFYSGFSIDPDGSLSLANVTASGYDALRPPITKAPLLEPMSASCGPMWLVDPSVAHNATHINSCKAAANLLGLYPRWGGVQTDYLTFFVDVDYFQC